MKGRPRFLRRNQGGICASFAALTLVALAAPGIAMTPEDCTRIRNVLAEAIPPVAELRLSPSVTQDGWCRVIGGPLGSGLEWQATDLGEGFWATFRQRAVEVEELGRFSLTGTVEQTAGGIDVGPILLTARDGASITVTAHVNAPADGSQTLGLDRAALQVASDARLLGDVLAWAFRLDAAAARSNFTIARDQRDDMLGWLGELPEGIGDAASRSRFEALVAAYPNARGTAVLSMGADGPVAFGGLLAAVLRGESFTRGDGEALLRTTGLRLTWVPR